MRMTIFKSAADGKWHQYACKKLDWFTLADTRELGNADFGTKYAPNPTPEDLCPVCFADYLKELNTRNPEFQECSGDPACCPENDGHGCCKPNPAPNTVDRIATDPGDVITHAPNSNTRAGVGMSPLTVSYAHGMVTIRGDDMYFAWIPHMYKGNRPGVGLQVRADIDEDSARQLCVKISKAVVEFCSDATSHRKSGEADGCERSAEVKS